MSGLRFAGRVLVTGASGFVGRGLVRRLTEAGAEVHVLSRTGSPAPGREVVRHEADLTDPARVAESVRAIAPELVFHLAAARAERSGADRARTWAVTVGGTANLLAALDPLDGVRLVTLGSALEYAGSATPIDESRTPCPTSFYGASKAAATSLVRAVGRARRQPWLVLRPFFAYGPGQERHKFVPAACEAAQAGRPIPLTAAGFRRDWLFVDDLVAACLRAAEADIAPGEVFNVASGQERTNEELARTIRALADSDSPLEPGRHPERPWDRERRPADVAKAHRVLGWSPRCGLEEGLLETLDWVRSGEAALT